MGEIPQPEEVPQEIIEPEKGYNFEQMAKIESAMISLVVKLKEVIDAEEYSALLSDEAGGRIPTLILKEIIEKRLNAQNDKKLKTYFLGAGQKTPRKHHNPEKYKELINRLGKMDFGDKKILIVTQYIETGKTFERIGKALQDIGIKNFDFAGTFIDKIEKIPFKEKERWEEIEKTFNCKLFTGVEGVPPQRFEELSGVKSQEPYSPYPARFSAVKHEDIRKTREDMKLMAGKIIEKVWPEENN